MTRNARVLAVVTLGLSLLVGLVGAGLVSAEERPAVWVGALSAGVLQAVVFASLPALLGPSKRFLIYALGMLARFGLFAFVALLALPVLKLAAAPVLLSLVVVLTVTTLLEPLFLQTRDTTVS